MDSSPQPDLLLERLKNLVGGNDVKVDTTLDALESEIKWLVEEEGQLRQQVQEFAEAYDKLTSPANKIGMFLKYVESGNLLISLGDAEYVAESDPLMKDTEFHPGERVKLNDAYAVVGKAEECQLGALAKVSEIYDNARLKISTDIQGQGGKLVLRSANLAEADIKVSDEIRLDASGRFAVEWFPNKKKSSDFFIERVNETTWESIGGQDEAIQVIRESIEHPLLYPEIYSKFKKKPTKGILLFGPPGCGKTLIGKAVAWNLARDYSERVGHEVKDCFLHINGPKILNMWLGESERIVREIFEVARDHAKEDQLVVIFIDEAESILRTRSSGKWLNISNTVVPQFCAEMDGLEGLENVVIILTSNRPDYIDPAILRPERIDRKVKIKRPDREAAREILMIYLNLEVPIDPEFIKIHGDYECARAALVSSLENQIFSKSQDTRFMTVRMRNGTDKDLFWSDFLSGALLKSVVDRAKDLAIRRAIDHKIVAEKAGITENDLTIALKSEFAENEIFPKSDALDDWLKLLDIEPENIVQIRTNREQSSKKDFRSPVT